jgi:hypothetical protein
MKRIYGNREAICGLNTSGSGQGPFSGSFEGFNEPLGSTKGVDFFLLDKLLLDSQK